MKLLSIIGARPQFIKVSVLDRRLCEKKIEHIILHTGQHYDSQMSDIFFEELGINPPKYNLNINGLMHGAMTGQMIEKIEAVLIEEAPDWVLLYGDTNSTLAGAIAATKVHIKIAHIEAGLRSFNNWMPEEINRILTDRISNLLFCPTETAFQNLMDEGFQRFKCKPVITGDIMYDVANNFMDKSSIDQELLKELNITYKKFILVTIHREENTKEVSRVEMILKTLKKLSKEFSIIFPIHPRTRAFFEENGLINKYTNANFKFIAPISYLKMLKLEKYARLICTDSGGIQKEAYFVKTPCITLRDETEWTELINGGWNLLIPPTNEDDLLKGIYEMLNNFNPDDKNYYGDGNSSEIMINELLKF